MMNKVSFTNKAITNHPFVRSDLPLQNLMKPVSKSGNCGTVQWGRYKRPELHAENWRG